MKALLLAIAFGAAAYAQVASATLVGTVTDASGAAVAGAAVTAAQKSTGFSRTTSTGTRGGYAFEQLAPGIYTLTLHKEGFRDLQADNVALELNQTARQDFKLTIGDSHEMITVSASVSPLQTDAASLGYRLDNTRIADLPLESRNVAALVTLGAGAIPRQLGGFVHDAFNDVQEGSRGSVALNPPINGSRSTMNAFLLDGAYDTDRNTFAIAVYPPMESVQEFHIQSSSAAAEFPQAGGAAIDVITKSGAKEWHGSAFEYLGNQKTDARNFFEDPSLPRVIFRQNEFGASLGGPVPRLKNTFFYGVYEGFRQQSGHAAQSLVPDAATRAGNFTGQNTIYDPLTSPRTPFPGNVIPKNRLDSIAQAYLATYEPLPNSNSTAGNYLDTTPNTSATDSASGRIDHQFGDGGLLTGRYTLNNENNAIAGSFPLLPISEHVRAQQAAVNYTKGAAAWLDESRLSFTRLSMFDAPKSAFHDNIAKDLGLANPPTDPLYFGLPYFNATDYSMVTDSPSLPQVQRNNMWHANNTLSLMRGQHTIKAGFDFIHFQFNYLQSNLARGTYTYTGVFTSVDGFGGATGDPFADFLLGDPQNTQHTVGSGQAYLRQSIYAGFVQDDWHLTPKLTVNVGLRYEYASPYTEARNGLLNLNFSTLPKDPQLQRVNSAVNPDRRNLAPRVGLAWQLPMKTVFRAGYGLYYSQEIAVETYDLVLNGLSNQANETQGNVAPVLTTQNGFAHTAATGFPSYFGIDPNTRTPYVQQWTSSLQHELPGKTLLEIAYAGSKGTHLGRFRQFNTPAHVELGQNLAPRPGDLQSLRSFPDLGEIVERQHIANSSYNSLQVKVEKSMSARLSLLASFVWAKSIDDADSVIPGLFDSVGAQDERNLRLERGLSFSNVGRRISAGYVLQLPSAHFAGPVLRGWSLSGNVTLQDGTPLNPFYFAVDFANSGTPNRPNVVPGQSVTLPRSLRNIERFFNSGAFSDPAPYTFGNAGRDTIPGPGNNIFDFALHRKFKVGERGAIQFRAESYNAFNHPNWGIPGPNPDFGPFFGRIFTSGEPRRTQVALRYDF